MVACEVRADPTKQTPEVDQTLRGGDPVRDQEEK